MSANVIHPTAILEGDIELGEGNYFGPNCIVEGPVSIGNNNWFGAFSIIGAMPEIRSLNHFAREHVAGIHIGDRNVIREGAQVHQGWQLPTAIGSDTFIMNQCYLAHDCQIEDGVTIASSSLLAGHVVVGRGANIGMSTLIHQRRMVGAGAVLGMGAVVVQDVPALAKAYGNPARVRGANTVGMQRAGAPDEFINRVTRLYEQGLYEQSEVDAVNTEWLEFMSSNSI